MKKKLIFMLLITLLLSGCTCEYNLKIEGNTYQEEIILTGNNDEVKLFNNDWQIPVDKENYENLGDDVGADNKGNYVIYDYSLSGNKLIFKNNFNETTISDSTAISSCYKLATINSFNNSLVISTSKSANCFDKYPTLSKITVNITTDLTATNNNADKINNNTYTWIITKDTSKGINLVLEKNNLQEDSITSNNQTNQKDKKDYTIYIFLLIILIILLFGNYIINKIKNKPDDIV